MCGERVEHSQGSGGHIAFLWKGSPAKEHKYPHKLSSILILVKMAQMWKSQGKAIPSQKKGLYLERMLFLTLHSKTPVIIKPNIYLDRIGSNPWVCDQSANTFMKNCMFSFIDAQWERNIMDLFFLQFIDATSHFKM